MTKKTILIGVSSFVMVLLTMPLGHALMIVMEHFLSKETLVYAAFGLGFLGFVITIVGIFVKGDTIQTLLGLFGGLLFWTGWVEFTYVYYANRYGVEPLLNSVGEVITKPEYLLMPSSVGFWVMFLMFYIFSIKTGCNFFNFVQKKVIRTKDMVELKPVVRNTAMVTFMELNLLLWTSYLVLLFCYDENLLGDRHPITMIVAGVCLIASILMMHKQLKISVWGYAIRYSIATVIIFWTFVEVLGRHDVFKEIWVHPLDYKTEMLVILVALIVTILILCFHSYRKRHSRTDIP